MNELSLRTKELGHGGCCVRRAGDTETQPSSLYDLLLLEGGGKVWVPQREGGYGGEGGCLHCPSSGQITILERTEQKQERTSRRGPQIHSTCPVHTRMVKVFLLRYDYMPDLCQPLYFCISRYLYLITLSHVLHEGRHYPMKTLSLFYMEEAEAHSR